MTAFRNISAIRLTLASIGLALLLLACAPAGQAQAGMDKHERKIHRKLLKYPEGRYLHLVLRSSTDNYGALGAVSDASFTFKSADTNAVSTYTYNDVVRVRTDREPIGKGSEPEHRYIRPRTLIIAGVLAAGAGVAVAEIH
jgi:hypothetical protein